MVVNTDGTQTKEGLNTSSTSEGTSGKTVTLTQQELDAMMKKTANDALAAAGRDAKGLAEAKKTIDDAVAKAQLVFDKAEKREKEADERELASAKDTTEEGIIRREQAVRQQERAIERQKLLDKAATDATLAEAAEGRKIKRETMVAAIVAKYGIDKGKLDELIDESMTEDRIDKLASALPKKQTETSKGDSGSTHGGNEDWKSIRDAYIEKPNDPVIRNRYLKARRERGL